MNSVFSTPKMNAVTPNTLEEEISKYRRQKVNWASYFQSHMITQVEFRLIHEFDRGDKLNRQKILEENRHELGTSLVALLEKVSKDETIHYILILIDEMLEEDHGRIESGTSSRKILPLNGPFLTLLNGHDGFIVYMCARIFARIASWSTLLLNQQDLKNYLLWLRDRLNSPGNSYIHTVVDCIQLVLRVDTYRGAFMSVDGMSAILKNLKSVKNFQIEYKLIFCIWVLTFNPEVAERMNKYNTIPVLADIFTGTETDKVTRIILGVFRNLVEQPHDRLVIREHCITMVQHKVLKQLSVLEQKPFDDDDVVEDIKFLSSKLQASVQDLSSFDEYVAEVKSGRLEWSPVHRSAQFWRENADRLNEKKYELLRILIHLLETSRDPLVLGVASYDIGEYVRHYPRGKGVIEDLGGKQVVMQLLSHDNPSVRYEALIALQKIMVQNWGYLGKQMEKDQN